VRVPRRLLLGWYNGGFEVQPGQRWSFTVRLRRPHGAMNPGGFDLEAWMLERNLRATGYVRGGPRDPSPVRLDSTVWRPGYVVERARSALRERLQSSVAEKRHGGVLLALVLGDQRAIGDEDWTLFNRTGIAHLVSISGLHITMIATLAGLVVGALWRRVPVLLARSAAQTAGIVAGLIAALLYALLAGWGSSPAIRPDAGDGRAARLTGSRSAWRLRLHSQPRWSASSIPGPCSHPDSGFHSAPSPRSSGSCRGGRLRRVIAGNTEC
jgi:competence protein ComEC